jgi:uncharacterized protein (DUF488 family)
VQAIADVRAFPSSRRNPQFNSGELRTWLPAAGIAYVHLPELGGRRRAVEHSPNGGWREPGFRGYADHMASTEFAAGLARLIDLAVDRRTAAMCAEALWWRCHRRLIADALTVRGWEVIHLGAGAERSQHQLPSFAVVHRGVLTYPPTQSSLFTEQPRSLGRKVD